GAAGLIAAEVLASNGLTVTVYDAMPSVGRKILMAGKGGLNLSHSENIETFLSRYGDKQDLLEPMIKNFSPNALRTWVHELGIETFVGSSGRVFPTDMKAAPFLRAWLHRLRGLGVKICVRHRWLGWQNNALCFATPNGEQLVQADAVLLALGGGSWKKLGSTGAWVEILQQHGVAVAPLQPSNCGFDVGWSDYFSQHHAGQPLKSVLLSFADFKQRGDLIITETGLEGGLIYAASALLRDACLNQNYAEIFLDLSPDKSEAWLTEKLAKPRGKQSLSTFLKKQINISGVKLSLLREVLTPELLNQPDTLAANIKALPIKLIAPRPIDEAISSAGGVKFTALNEHLMLHDLAGVFCAGEMLDWEAPTGGYLLTACFATGKAAAYGILNWLETN
ncbi:partial putative protein, partial [Anaerolineae bacterium]